MATLAFLNNLGPPEMIVILIVALLVFGGRLPEVGRNLGRGLAQFRKGLQDMKDEIEKDEPSPRPPAPPAAIAPSERPALPAAGSEDPRPSSPPNGRR